MEIKLISSAVLLKNIALVVILRKSLTFWLLSNQNRLSTCSGVNIIVPVSAIVLTYNEEQLVEDCLKSLEGWLDEILVVDSGSTDRTVEIAQKYQTCILHHPFRNYSQQRNWAQQQPEISHEWVLHIDADERVTAELRNEIEDFFSTGTFQQFNGVLMSRRTVFMGRWIRYGGHYPSYHLRLFKRDRGQCEDRLYDQHFTVDGKVISLNGDLLDTITADLDKWTMRHINWANLEANQYFSITDQIEKQVEGKLTGTPIEQKRWLRNSVYNRLPLFLRVITYFIYRYIFRLGFLDGKEGLIFHVLQGFWFRFYIDAKIYEAQVKQKL